MDTRILQPYFTMQHRHLRVRSWYNWWVYPPPSFSFSLHKFMFSNRCKCDYYGSNGPCEYACMGGICQSPIGYYLLSSIRSLILEGHPGHSLFLFSERVLLFLFIAFSFSFGSDPYLPSSWFTSLFFIFHSDIWATPVTKTLLAFLAIVPMALVFQWKKVWNKKWQ